MKTRPSANAVSIYKSVLALAKQKRYGDARLVAIDAMRVAKRSRNDAVVSRLVELMAVLERHTVAEKAAVDQPGLDAVTLKCAFCKTLTDDPVLSADHAICRRCLDDAIAWVADTTHVRQSWSRLPRRGTCGWCHLQTTDGVVAKGSKAIICINCLNSSGRPKRKKTIGSSGRRRGASTG